jgi:plastocyanin
LNIKTYNSKYKNMTKINLSKTIKTLMVLSSFALLVPLASVNASTSTVYIYDNNYSPQTLTVPVGTTVTWINSGNSLHTVTSDTGMFNSGTLNSGSSYSLSMNIAGTYQYHCNFYGSNTSGMRGTIIVTADTNSTTDTLVGTVQSGPPIVINQITPVQTSAQADGTYANGWKWIFDITAPVNETTLMMKFSNWLNTSNSSTIPVSNNMRFYSTQSSNAYSQATAIPIGASNTYSSGMYLTGDLDTATNTRRVQITVEIKIPVGTTAGSYSTNYGIKTQ